MVPYYSMILKFLSRSWNKKAKHLYTSHYSIVVMKFKQLAQWAAIPIAAAGIAYAALNTNIKEPRLEEITNGSATFIGYETETFGYVWQPGKVYEGKVEKVPATGSLWGTFENTYGRRPRASERIAMKYFNEGKYPYFSVGDRVVLFNVYDKGNDK